VCQHYSSLSPQAYRLLSRILSRLFRLSPLIFLRAEGRVLSLCARTVLSGTIVFPPLPLFICSCILSPYFPELPLRSFRFVLLHNVHASLNLIFFFSLILAVLLRLFRLQEVFSFRSPRRPLMIYLPGFIVTPPSLPLRYSPCHFSSYSPGSCAATHPPSFFRASPCSSLEVTTLTYHVHPHTIRLRDCQFCFVSAEAPLLHFSGYAALDCLCAG